MPLRSLLFPRFCERGPIEATLARSYLGPGTSSFRASVSAAPLKHRVFDQFLAPALGFRASVSAAPLKLFGASSFVAHIIVFPRFCERGPIEAKMAVIVS